MLVQVPALAIVAAPSVAASANAVTLNHNFMVFPSIDGQPHWRPYTRINYNCGQNMSYSYGEAWMSRPRRWDENMTARFPEGTFKRIEAVLGEDEYRTDFVWEAVERELKRRERNQSIKQ